MKNPLASARYADVAATLALLLAVSGGGVAMANHLKVRSGDIVNGQVKTPDLHKRAVTSAKIKPKAVTAGKRAAGPQVRVQESAIGSGYPIPTNTGTTIAFNIQDFDTGGLWSPAAPDRLRIKRAGTYLLVGDGVWNSQPGGTERNLCIRAQTSGGSYLDGACRRDVPNGSWTLSQHLPLVTQLDKGDEVRLRAFHDRGVTANLLTPRLSAVWLGPQK